MFEDSQPTQEEASLKVHRSRSVRRVEVTTDGRNLVSHAGTALLCELADRTGLTRAMSVAMADCGISWNTHDPGVVLTHPAVAIADGGDGLSDFEALRSQSEQSALPRGSPRRSKRTSLRTQCFVGSISCPRSGHSLLRGY